MGLGTGGKLEAGRSQHWPLGVYTYYMESIIFLHNSKDVLYFNSIVPTSVVIGLEHAHSTGIANVLSKFTCNPFYVGDFNYWPMDEERNKFKCKWL